MNANLGTLPSSFRSASRRARTPSQVQATARPMPEFSTFYQKPQEDKEKGDGRRVVCHLLPCLCRQWRYNYGGKDDEKSRI